MKKSRKLRIQIFTYMIAVIVIWFAAVYVLAEYIYFLEDKRGVEFPQRFYITFDCIQAVLLVLMNIPFVRFLIKHIDRPVRKIVDGLNKIADGKYDEKIDFDAKNELDEIKNAFNEMVAKLADAEKIKQNAENERVLLFANMAHDLKMPITSIIGFSKALSDGIIEDEKKQAQCITTINSKALKMNDLIDRLFEYVKLESAENRLHLDFTDVAEVLRNCIADVYTEYEEKNILPEIDIPDEPIIKNADKLELSRVYTNLLSNVIKHNLGSIRVLVRMKADGKVIIADSGEALPYNIAENLFTPFVSGDSFGRNVGGSGLGLSLAYKIMKKHGGDLRFIQGDDEVPKGYTKGFVAGF